MKGGGERSRLLPIFSHSSRLPGALGRAKASLKTHKLRSRKGGRKEGSHASSSTSTLRAWREEDREELWACNQARKRGRRKGKEKSMIIIHSGVCISG